jgi:hypothetical protein
MLAIVIIAFLLFVIWLILKLKSLWEQASIETKFDSPPSGFKRISIKKLPAEWTELEKRTILGIENFILYGWAVSNYKSFREDYLNKHPERSTNDICWSFLQFTILEFAQYPIVCKKMKETMEQFEFSEKYSKN